MNLMSVIALAMSMFSATAFYAASPNCLWPSMQQWRRWSAASAVVLSALSIGMWIAAAGIGVGLCAMLGTCMLTLVALPWLALRTSSPNATTLSTPDHD
jgi:hypothetical protein